MDEDIVSRYLKECVERGFRQIFETQRAIAAEKIYGKQAYTRSGKQRSRSGMLQQALESPSFSITGKGYSVSAIVNYPMYIRFLDMKRIGNYRIYNRPIWGILYKETFQDIRYEFREWLKKNFGETIKYSYE